jgi:hypothetical protein
VLTQFGERAGPKTGNDVKEIGLEGLNDTLGSIATMDIWRDKLVMHFPRILNGGPEFGATSVVEDLLINVVAQVG